jgi:hypothetical protein
MFCFGDAVFSFRFSVLKFDDAFDVVFLVARFRFTFELVDFGDPAGLVHPERLFFFVVFMKPIRLQNAAFF